MYQGIVLPVSLLGSSNSIKWSMSSIIACRLIRAVRRCLLRPSAAVSPGCAAQEPQPLSHKTKTHKITNPPKRKKTRLGSQTIPKILETEPFFITFPFFLKPNRPAILLSQYHRNFHQGRLRPRCANQVPPVKNDYISSQPYCQCKKCTVLPILGYSDGKSLLVPVNCVSRFTRGEFRPSPQSLGVDR